ncbi:hypothetical protein ES319_D01G050400v1 [Gossypium barbadense]|uniref:Uncharacterized protein n=1 Tax=Gossypium barbadense TaxID=3634 RepID=A0A5J5SNP2_GOSBA|nr:hypothetical protein ES319_D01G050400v1 [Gossypium barbadense]
MAEEEEGAIRRERANKAAATKIKGNHIPCFSITLNPIPQTTVCSFLPGDCLSPRYSTPWVKKGAINGKGVAELGQGKTLVMRARR